MSSSHSFLVWTVVPFVLGVAITSPALGQPTPLGVSTCQFVDEIPLDDGTVTELAVQVEDPRGPGGHPQLLPVRVVLTARDGSHPDGSGRGTYADGRFFADGTFSVRVLPGPTRLHLQAGPNYVPLETTVEAKAGTRRRYKAALHRWFSPEERGWYGGDNHVHAQHDATAAIRTNLAYTALQARAAGLSYITEAGSATSYADKDRLDTPTFLFRHAQELRPGPFVGHFNTPGITQALPRERYEHLIKRPLPAQAIGEAIHELHGAVIHTHPLTPIHQLHWMGAGEIYADAVLGRCADALDVDSPASEALWFTVLNLGNKVACSGSTDSALGRVQTPSPGDRRVYVHAREFTYLAIVAALRQGRTLATNGGPVFPFLTIDGHESGETIASGTGHTHVARLEIHSLYAIKSVRLYCRGKVARSFDVAGQKGAVVLTHELNGPGKRPDWYVLRVEDERGHWAITSPVYIEPAQAGSRPFASALMLSIANHTRFVQLRREFFAHVLVTVGPEDALAEVQLLRDDQVLQSFQPETGNQLAEGRIPVTESDGDYGHGWMWHRQGKDAVHLQADVPVKESGWYAIRARTARGRTLISTALRFDADHPQSHALSTGCLTGEDGRFELRGYGEEMPLADIRLPFLGDHWWYPRRTWWQVQATFGGQTQDLKGGAEQQAQRFRTAPALP